MKNASAPLRVEGGSDDMMPIHGLLKTLRQDIFLQTDYTSFPGFFLAAYLTNNRERHLQETAQSVGAVSTHILKNLTNRST